MKHSKEICIFFSCILFVITVFGGCSGKEKKIVLGNIGSGQPELGDYVYELWDTRNMYKSEEKQYKDKYGVDIFEGEAWEEKAKKEAYENFIRTYILAGCAIEAGMSLSTEVSDENGIKADAVMSEMGESLVSEYEITKEGIKHYLDCQSLSGIWFGERIEALEDELRNDLNSGADGSSGDGLDNGTDGGKKEENVDISDNEIREKAYELFEKEYKDLYDETDIKLDDSLINSVLVK